LPPCPHTLIACANANTLQNGQPSDAQAPHPHADGTENDKSQASQRLSNLENTQLIESIQPDVLPSPHAFAQPPRLTPSKSAPTDIDAMLQPTSFQNATMTRATSFHGFAGGDTQPMESQIYRDWTESMSKSTGTTPQKTILHFDATTLEEQNTYALASANGRTQHTMDQGSEGFVDLDGAWQRDDSPTAKSATSGYEELLAGPETQSQDYTGAIGSFAPRTPGLNKRKRSGDIPTSATDASRKTPAGLSQLFGMSSKMPILSATQLFDQTQAQSSPTADAARSDPVADRPSPNLNTLRDLSPDVISSSPVLMLRNPPASTAGGPRDTYTSMRESQERRADRERRAALLRQDLDLQSRFGPSAIAELEDYDEEDTQQIRLERQRLKRVMSDQANDEWSRYRAPSRPGHRATSAQKQTTTIDLVTPGTLRKQGRVQFDLLDDEDDDDQATDDDDMEVDLPVEAEDTHDGEGVPDVERIEENDDDNDVYDEYGQTVLRSQRDPDDDEDDQRPALDDDEDVLDIDPNEDGAVDKEDALREDIGMAIPHGEVVAGTQPAVVDSQPERLEAQRSLLSKEHIGQPNPSSIIPGSQYAGVTSQEVARLANRVPNSSTLSQKVNQEPARNTIEDRRVPSSPPIAGVSSAEQDDEDMEDTLARRELLAKFKPNTTLHGGAKESIREIPESDQPDRDNAELVGEETLFETAAESNVAAPFSTAQTNLDDSGRTPEKPRLVKELSKASASQQSSMPTPLKAAGVRRFADIAADPSPPEYGGESQLDMDAIMGNVFTMDDQNFMDVLSSPPSEKPTKRRRLLPSDKSRRRSRLPSMEVATSELPSESVNQSSSTVKEDAPVETSEATLAAPAHAINELRTDIDQANDVPFATPEEAKAPDTPESVRRREEAGAKAASKLLSARPTLSAKSKKAKVAKVGRDLAALRASERKPVSRRTSSKLKKVMESSADELAPEDATSLQGEGSEQGAHTDDQALAGPTVADASDAPASNTLTVIAPERVLALFSKGGYNAYYPATWISASPDGSSHVVRFDDTTVTTVDAKRVRALDLKIGDVVKVDYEGFRSKSWIVKSFGRKALNDDDRANGVDIYGHVVLRVQAKLTQRESMPAPGVAVQSDGDIQEIMVTNVKVTHNMITHFADRVFHPPHVSGIAASNNGTPSTKAQSVEAEITPSRTTRRAAASTTKSIAREPSKLREESVASSTDITGAGMFEGMAFAISYASNENEKFDVTRLIRRNGGLILEQGFDELFIAPQLEEQTTPTKRSAKTATSAQNDTESGSLRLKPEYESLGFIALIADKHSRRAKYMQALALDLPTLSGRWIVDSFNASRNVGFPNTPRPWTHYLLPAGESSYLGGAIRSRTLPYYNPRSAKLSSTVATRALLLDGAGVLLVAPKKGKGTWERRKAYAFLTLALGAGSVRRVADLAEAKKLLASDAEKQKWLWVYVDDDVNDAAKTLFGGNKGSGGSTAGRKRKRNEGPQMCVEGMQGRVKVVADEFVVQSLILGALVD
jgi:hypothetical protein